MKKRLIILIPIAIALIAFLIIYGYYNKENKNTSLTVNEKRWVEKNKDTEVSFEIVNDYPVYAMNGEGVLFDFLEDFEKNVGLEFDENPYQKTGQPTGTDYRIRILSNEAKLTDKDLKIFDDYYLSLSFIFFCFPQQLQSPEDGYHLSTFTRYFPLSKSL